MREDFYYMLEDYDGQEGDGLMDVEDLRLLIDEQSCEEMSQKDFDALAKELNIDKNNEIRFAQILDYQIHR